MEGREGTSRQGGGGVEESDSDDDLEVTWESDTPDAAEGADDAISDNPVASEGSSPSTIFVDRVRLEVERVFRLQTAAIAAAATA